MLANENIFNIVILENIFQYVNFYEQLLLTRVCGAFQDVIVNCLWKQKYKELEIVQTPEYYILTNKINYKYSDLETRIILHEDKFEEFLFLNANNVQIFKFCLMNEGDEITTSFAFKNKWPNLTSLSFTNAIITDDSLNMLSTYCPQLENLCFVFCVNPESQRIVLGQDIKVKYIENIKTLKCLEVHDQYQRHSNIKEILMKLQLLQLILRFNIVPDEGDDDDFQLSVDEDYDDCELSEDEEHDAFGLLEVNSTNISTCKALTLGPFYKTTCFIKLKHHFLNHFQNLTNLTIIGNRRSTIKDKDFFVILMNYCDKLKYLELENFTITNFVTPKTVNEIVLRRCKGLTCRDLEFILCDLKLKAFTTTETSYSGTMSHNITASKTLEFLQFDCNQLTQLWEMHDFNGFSNLSSLKYLNNLKCVLKHTSTQCPNLRKLYMKENGISIDDLYKLKTLEKLELDYTTYRDLSKLMLILKHSTLTHFVIRRFQDNDDDTVKYEDSVDVKTNLLFINIPMNMFLELQDFWLKLLNRNPKLHIMFHDYPSELLNHSFMETLITHQKFPNMLKTIKICGFDIDCQSFRDEFDITMCHIITMTRYLPPFKKYLIIL